MTEALRRMDEHYFQLLDEDMELRESTVRQHYERIAAFNRSLDESAASSARHGVYDATLVMARQKALVYVACQRRDWDLTAQSSEVLVPIRLDVDLENIKYRDVLTWNLNGTASANAAAKTGVRLAPGLVGEKRARGW